MMSIWTVLWAQMVKAQTYRGLLYIKGFWSIEKKELSLGPLNLRSLSLMSRWHLLFLAHRVQDKALRCHHFENSFWSITKLITLRTLNIREWFGILSSCILAQMVKGQAHGAPYFENSIRKINLAQLLPSPSNLTRWMGMIKRWPTMVLGPQGQESGSQELALEKRFLSNNSKINILRTFKLPRMVRHDQ